ncbi:MAG: hypothetical protein JSS98_03740 [Bacteroidetes bacterium]|nr:hypothetical protein [Bacteroidota bacterium]
MKKKINFCLVILILCSICAFAQKNPSNKSKSVNALLSKEQKFKDSAEFAKFKEKNPDRFLNKRLPIKLIGDGYVVEGFSTAIQMKGNLIKDSVYHNFYPGMPDTTTVSPFNDIKVTNSKINIELFSNLMMMGGKNRDSAEITSVEPDLIVDNKIGNFPISDFYLNSIAIKISINGKLLFDWKPIEDFSKKADKVSEKFLDFHEGGMYGYIYGHSICDTNLNINDQLLIEIKNTKNNWMIDRYNITRVEASPNILGIQPLNNKTNSANKGFTLISQKKTLALNPMKEN